jgi:hypothetical protein
MQNRCLKFDSFFALSQNLLFKKIIYFFIKNRFWYSLFRLFNFIDLVKPELKLESKFDESLLCANIKYSSMSNDDLNFFWSNFTSKYNWIVKKYRKSLERIPRL